jgi:transcriptional regulator with XRE-family HTH domain
MMQSIDNTSNALYIMHMDVQQIGQKVREARKSMGRTQAEVAVPLGMSRATVSAIENGTVSEIGVRKLMALCASLGLALSVAPRDQRPTFFELREEQRAALKSRT